LLELFRFIRFDPRVDVRPKDGAAPFVDVDKSSSDDKDSAMAGAAVGIALLIPGTALFASTFVNSMPCNSMPGSC